MILDRCPAPPFRPLVHTEYVDNFVALSRSETKVGAAVRAVKASLEAAKLPTHETTVTLGGEALGWSFAPDSPSVRVAPRVAWRLRLGLLGLIDKGRATGRQLSCLIGNFTFRALLRREMLSALSASYASAEVHRNAMVPLWPSVIKEMRWCAALFGLGTREFDARGAMRLLASTLRISAVVW